MNFSENELPRKDRTSSFLTYGEAGKRVLKFQANFSRFSKYSSQMTGQISFKFDFEFPIFHFSTVMYVDQPLRDKPLKTAFGSTEKP